MASVIAYFDGFNQYQGLPVALEAGRQDQLLEEALISRADPHHLARMFGLSTFTSVRYTQAARLIVGDNRE